MVDAKCKLIWTSIIIIIISPFAPFDANGLYSFSPAGVVFCRLPDLVPSQVQGLKDMDVNAHIHIFISHRKILTKSLNRLMSNELTDKSINLYFLKWFGLSQDRLKTPWLDRIGQNRS